MSGDFEENALGTGVLGDTIFGPELPSEAEFGDPAELRKVYVKAENRLVIARSDLDRTVFAQVAVAEVVAALESRLVFAVADQDRSVDDVDNRVVNVTAENRLVVLPLDLEI